MMDKQRERRVALATSEAREWRIHRDAEIVAAHQKGDSLREIVRATRMSRPTVKKIVEKRARLKADEPGVSRTS
jgi:Mor family transcriptional regulator